MKLATFQSQLKSLYMSPFESDQDKTIPLSHAHVKRRDNSRIETFPTELEDILTRVLDRKFSEKIERLERHRQDTETDLEQMLTRVVNKEVTDKIVRLEKSIDRMVAQFQAIQSGESEDAALRVTTDLESADIALANIQLNQEDYYPYTCGMIAEKLGINTHKVVGVIKKLSMRGNTSYHKCFQIGVKSFTHKYSEEALIKIKKEVESSNLQN